MEIYILKHSISAILSLCSLFTICVCLQFTPSAMRTSSRLEFETAADKIYILPRYMCQVGVFFSSNIWVKKLGGGGGGGCLEEQYKDTI